MAAFPNSRLKGEANLLIMPTIDAANISFNLLKVSSGGGVTLGPILLGVAKPVHILDAVGDGAPHRQHDRADRRRRDVQRQSQRSDADRAGSRRRSLISRHGSSLSLAVCAEGGGAPKRCMRRAHRCPLSCNLRPCAREVPDHAFSHSI